MYQIALFIYIAEMLQNYAIENRVQPAAMLLSSQPFNGSGRL